MVAETKRATVPRHPPPGKSPLQAHPSGPSAVLVKCGPRDAEGIKAFSRWLSEARATPPVTAPTTHSSRRDGSHSVCFGPYQCGQDTVNA